MGLSQETKKKSQSDFTLKGTRKITNNPKVIKWKTVIKIKAEMNESKKKKKKKKKKKHRKNETKN